MSDSFYPSVDFQFVEEHLKATGKFEAYFTVGATSTFILSGSQAIFKRSVSIRQLEPGQVCYEQASGLAARFGFLGQLIKWLEQNRHWKEGGYIVPNERKATSENYRESGGY